MVVVCWELSIELKEVIVFLYLLGLKYLDIVWRLEIFRFIILFIIDWYCKWGSVENNCWKGKYVKLSDRDSCKFLRLVKENRKRKLLDIMVLFNENRDFIVLKRIV